MDSNKEILQISFRSHHNAYRKNDGSGAEILDLSLKPEGSWYRFCQIVFGVITLHYILWFIPLFIGFWIPYWFGYPVVSLGLIIYYFYTYFQVDELKFGRPWESFRLNLLWRMLQHYIDLEVIREVSLDPSRKYIFAHHPHGIIVLTRIGCYAGVFEKLFPGIQFRTLAASPMFGLPGCREMCLWLGAIRADKRCAVNLLKSSNNLSLLVYPGGSAEIFETNKGSKETVIVSRKGFIRLALEQGADIVPSFGFGEKNAYRKLTIPKNIANFVLKYFRMPLLLFWGRFFSLIPLELESGLSIVYGKPIRIEKPGENPSQELIDEYYEKYYTEIRRLFHSYKSKYGYADDVVLIIKEERAKTLTNGLKTH